MYADDKVPEGVSGRVTQAWAFQDSSGGKGERQEGLSIHEQHRPY